MPDITTHQDAYIQGLGRSSIHACVWTSPRIRSGILNIRDETNQIWVPCVGMLDDIPDVSAREPDNGDVLAYDSTNKIWVSGPPGAGVGDMAKSTYDTDNDGAVNNAENLNGHPDTYFATQTDLTTISLPDLDDVDISSPQEGDVIHYDSASGHFHNAAPTGGADHIVDLLDVNISSPLDDQALCWDTATSYWINKTVSGGPGGGITVAEIDNSPSVTEVTTIKVSNGSLTDNGSGTVTITTGGSGGVSVLECLVFS